MIPSETPDIESSSPAYAKRFSGAVGEYFLEVQQNAVSKLLGDVSGVDVLDIGGGHAQLTPFLVRTGANVTVLGSDAAGEQQLAALLNPSEYKYQTGNLLELPFEDQSFDVVIALRLLPHLVNWQRFVAEMCRVAKSAVVVDYPDKRSVNYFSDALFAAKKAVEHNTRPYRCFSGGELAVPFNHAEFQASDTVRQFALPMALHRALGSRTVASSLEGVMGAVGIRQFFGSPVIRKYERHDAGSGQHR